MINAFEIILECAGEKKLANTTKTQKGGKLAEDES